MSYIDCYDCEKDRCTCNCMKCHYHWLATRYKSNGQNNVRVAIKLVLGNSCRRCRGNKKS